MKNHRLWMHVTAVVAAAVVLGGCGDTARRASRAQVVVEANTDVPLSLVVSTDFDMVLNLEDGSSTPFLNNTDSLAVTTGYDELYALDGTDPKFYAKLENEEGENETVRMTVLLDGEVAYDVSVEMAAGAFLEYIYHFNSLSISRN